MDGFYFPKVGSKVTPNLVNHSRSCLGSFLQVKKNKLNTKSIVSMQNDNHEMNDGGKLKLIETRKRSKVGPSNG